MQNKIISKAPGRVCLFGDHQDYLGLPIIATTIDKEITIEAIKNNTQEFKIFKKDLDIHDSISLNQNINSDEKDFLRIALRVLKKYDCIPNEGYDIEIKSEIPINSGLSSSSALIVAWVNFLLSTFSDKSISPKILADLSYEIEARRWFRFRISKRNSKDKSKHKIFTINRIWQYCYSRSSHKIWSYRLSSKTC